MPYFDAHMNKVDKVNAPLLIIGLGGTGADGLRRIKHEFSQRLKPDMLGGKELDRPKRTAYLLLDTDPTEVNRRYHGTALNADTEFINLSSNMEYLLANRGQNLTPEERVWFDPKFYEDPDLAKEAATNGAGTYRQLSRLCLFHHIADVKSKLAAIMKTLKEVEPGSPQGATKIAVAVISGLCGGTGSGTFLDMAYLIRQAANDSATGCQVVLDLYAIAPDLTINRQATGDPTKQNIYKTNSFAALKELDYFMSIGKRHAGHVADDSYRVRYPGGSEMVWTNKPYDDVTLLCATNSDGSLIRGAYDIAMQSFVESLVFAYSFENPRSAVYAGQDASTASDSFSFQSAKSNEYAYKAMLRHDYPEEHNYRAIGAYSNLSEQRNRVSIEGNMVFQDLKKFADMQEHQVVMDGPEPANFFASFFDDTYHALYKELCDGTKYPTEVLESNSVSEIQDNPPHQDAFDSWKKACKQYVFEEQNAFHEALKKSLCAKAIDFMHKKGPDALLTILRDPQNGIALQILKKKSQMENGMNMFLNEVSETGDRAENAFKTWKNSVKGVLDLVGLLKEPNARREYLFIAEQKYQKQQELFFYTAMVKALEMLHDELTNKMIKLLDCAVRAVATIRDELEKDVKDNVPNGDGHLVTIDQLKADIAAQYNANRNNQLLREKAFDCIGKYITDWQYTANDKDAEDQIVGGLQELIDSIFSTINRMDITATLQTAGVVGDQNAIADYAKNVLAPQLDRGASVMFATADGYGKLSKANGNAVVASYISVPDDQPDLLRGIRTFVEAGQFNGATFKLSEVRDRVFWLNIVCGLPLCAYFAVDEYEAVYQQYRSMRAGTHLVMTNDPNEQNVMHNWALMPSPNPFMLAGKQGGAQNFQTENRAKTDAVCERAERDGLVTLELDVTTIGNSSATLHMLEYADKETIREKLGKVSALPIGDVANETNAAKLDALKNAAEAVLHEVSALRAHEKAEKLDSLEYIENRMHKFVSDQNVDDHKFLSRDHQALETCFRAYVYYMLSKRPALLDKLKEQHEMLELIREKEQEIKSYINKVEAQRASLSAAADEWTQYCDKVIEGARVVARLSYYDLIKCFPMRATYRGFDGEYTTDGQPNVLYNMTDSLHATDGLSVLLGIEFTLPEWFAMQTKDVEPFTSLMERMAELDAECDGFDPASNPEDAKKLHAYMEAAKKLENTVKMRRNKIHVPATQKQMDPKWYKLADATLGAYADYLNNFVSNWEAYM